MNQQRSRRFRASKEGVELTEEKAKMREEIIERGMEENLSVLGYGEEPSVCTGDPSVCTGVWRGTFCLY